MNDERIIKWIDSLFEDMEQTDRLLAQKEELKTHLLERTKEYMVDSIGFDEAFIRAQIDLGDIEELKASFLQEEDIADRDDWDDDWDEDDDEDEEHADYGGDQSYRWKLTALSPFLFIFLCATFGWWAWAWVIIPVTAICLNAGLPPGQRFIALSPFIYILAGFFFGWWAWGWAIIPISGILLHDK